ncbi:MAG: penicillin-binding transpeptidase domain-containing protein [Planctomycetota bacterium]|nr:penicillin-binding transpeptidase domain-containing protein [Planctomycetota bacterium]
MGRNTLLLLFALFSAIVLGGLLFRLIQMQVFQFEYYDDLAERKRFRLEVLDAGRGTIFDRNGVPLSYDSICYDVAVVMDEFDPTFNIAKLLEREVPSLGRLKEILSGFDAHLSSVLSGSVTSALCLKRIDCGKVHNETRLKNLKEKYPLKYGALEIVTLENGETRLFLNPEVLYRRISVLNRLAEILQTDFETLFEKSEKIRKRLFLIKNAFERRYEMSRPQVLLSDISREQAFQIELKAEELVGVTVIGRRKRMYRGEAFAHITGYTRQLNDEEVKKYQEEGRLVSRAYNPPEAFERIKQDSFFLDDEVGACGAELSFQSLLAGRKGAQLLEQDIVTRRYKILQKIEPERGKDVYLTLDSSLQEALYDAFKKRGLTGAAVLLHPFTGEILALVSHPSFDPNRIRESAYYKALLEPPYPLLERSFRSAYSPGSTMKIAAAIAALSEGTITSTTYFECRGYHKNPSSFRCWIYPSAHGPQNLSDALKHSCNAFFFELADRMDGDKLVEWFRRLGIGEAPLLEIGATKGVLPTRQWKRARYEDALRRMKEMETRLKEPGENEKENLISPIRKEAASYEGGWLPSDSRNLSVGQGALLVSPLQVARMVAVVANGGTLINPTILLENMGKGVSLSLSPSVLDSVKEGMWRAVHESGGTANKSGLSKFNVYAKTGTAEVSKKEGLNHAWIAGFTSSNEMKVVFAILVERTKEHGGYICAPIASEILEKMFESNKGTDNKDGKVSSKN